MQPVDGNKPCQFHFRLPKKVPKRARSVAEEAPQLPPVVVRNGLPVPVPPAATPPRHIWIVPAHLFPVLDGQEAEVKKLLMGLLIEYETDRNLPSFLGSLLAFGKNEIQARPRQAVIMLEKALQMNPEDGLALASLGALLAFGAKGVYRDPKRAEQLLLAALEFDANNARALTFFGCLLASGTPGVTENLEMATESLEKAIAIQQAPAYFEASHKSIFSPGNLYDLAKALAFMGAIEAFFLEDKLDRDCIIDRFQRATRYDSNEPLYLAWQGLHEEKLGQRSGQSKVWAFFLHCTTGAVEEKQKMHLFLYTIRTDSAQRLLKKYQTDNALASANVTPYG